MRLARAWTEPFDGHTTNLACIFWPGKRVALGKGVTGVAWEYLKFFHIVFAFVMVGGISISEYAMVQARRTTEPATFGAFVRMSAAGGIVSGVSLIVVSVLGVLTAWQQHIPLTSTGWLNAAYATVIVATILPMATFARWGKKAEGLVPEALEKGAVLPEQKQLISGTRYHLVNGLMILLLVWVVYIMVFKPF